MKVCDDFHYCRFSVSFHFLAVVPSTNNILCFPDQHSCDSNSFFGVHPSDITKSWAEGKTDHYSKRSLRSDFLYPKSSVRLFFHITYENIGVVIVICLNKLCQSHLYDGGLIHYVDECKEAITCLYAFFFCCCRRFSLFLFFPRKSSSYRYASSCNKQLTVENRAIHDTTTYNSWSKISFYILSTSCL